MHQVQRGVWLDGESLAKDLERREGAEVGRIAEWIGASGVHDAVQDERLIQLLRKANPAGRLAILRVAARRKRGASVQLIKQMLSDPDERIARLAAREMIRRKPVDGDQVLLQLMGNAPESVRRVVSRAVGQSSFDSYWNRFDRLDKATRKQAGKAMLKVLPEAVTRLERKLNNGPTEQRLKALMVTQELGLAEGVREALIGLTKHANPKVRSKAVTVIGELPAGMPEVILDRVLTDEDPRVRANAIEVLEAKKKDEYVPLLTQRARSAHNRERANAIKALHRMKVGTSIPQLTAMLQDARGEHRISALWAMKQMGVWKLIQQVGLLAKSDENIRVRRYALNVLKDVAEMVNEEKKRRAG
jgi:HEAT repeat protein